MEEGLKDYQNRGARVQKFMKKKSNNVPRSLSKKAEGGNFKLST